VGIERARRESWIKDIRRLAGMHPVIVELFGELRIDNNVKIGINKDTIRGVFYEKYMESFSKANVSRVIQEIRSIKSGKERLLIEKGQRYLLLGMQR